MPPAKRANGAKAVVNAAEAMSALPELEMARTAIMEAMLKEIECWRKASTMSLVGAAPEPAEPVPHPAAPNDADKKKIASLTEALEASTEEMARREREVIGKTEELREARKELDELERERIALSKSLEKATRKIEALEKEAEKQEKSAAGKGATEDVELNEKVVEQLRRLTDQQQQAEEKIAAAEEKEKEMTRLADKLRAKRRSLMTVQEARQQIEQFCNEHSELAAKLAPTLQRWKEEAAIIHHCDNESVVTRFSARTTRTAAAMKRHKSPLIDVRASTRGAPRPPRAPSAIGIKPAQAVTTTVQRKLDLDEAEEEVQEPQTKRSRR